LTSSVAPVSRSLVREQLIGDAHRAVATIHRATVWRDASLPCHRRGERERHHAIVVLAARMIDSIFSALYGSNLPASNRAAVNRLDDTGSKVVAKSRLEAVR
jgi:hypothetical protein